MPLTDRPGIKQRLSLHVMNDSGWMRGWSKAKAVIKRNQREIHLGRPSTPRDPEQNKWFTDNGRMIGNDTQLNRISLAHNLSGVGALESKTLLQRGAQLLNVINARLWPVPSAAFPFSASYLSHSGPPPPPLSSHPRLLSLL